MTEPPRNPPPPWGKSRTQVVRLVCPCGRNIADVRPVFGQPPEGVGPALRDKLGYEHVIIVVARPGVRYSGHGRPGGGITHRWDCRCRKTWEARDDRLDAIWREFAEPGHVVRLTLGHDVM